MDGILVVDKPKGMTSHDVVDFIRRSFRIKKAGHAGTLDPAATGILVILIGRATKLSSGFTGAEKEYEATLTLGKKTDTADAQGKVLSAGDYSKLTQERIKEAFDSFIGEIEQVPPMVSAVNYKGRRLYKLAREGKVVAPQPRKIHIKELVIKRAAVPQIDFSIKCSKGTYVRKLCDDIGDKLGCGAHLSYLRRTRSGEFGLDRAVTVEELKKYSEEDLERYILKI